VKSGDMLAFIDNREIVLTIENITSFYKILQDYFHFGVALNADFTLKHRGRSNPGLLVSYKKHLVG
jgi:hypothetical protein